MLTQLSTLKSRLALSDLEIQYDDLLTFAIEAISARFDRETNRTLARTENATFEFDSTDTEFSVPCYPIESISKFETKMSESEGWSEVTDVEHLIRKSCIISLSTDFRLQTSDSILCIARVTYTGGYLLPGSAAVPAATSLPSDLENAAVEQVAAWFLRRDMLGLDASWPKGGVMQRFSKLDLLLPVQTVLKRHARWTI